MEKEKEKENKDEREKENDQERKKAVRLKVFRLRKLPRCIDGLGLGGGVHSDESHSLT